MQVECVYLPLIKLDSCVTVKSVLFFVGYNKKQVFLILLSSLFIPPVIIICPLLSVFA